MKVVHKALLRRGFKHHKGNYSRRKNGILIQFSQTIQTTKYAYMEAYAIEKGESGYGPYVNTSAAISTVKHIDDWIDFAQVK